MRAEPDCILCGIVAGEISSTTMAQSERAIAFMDLNPVTHGHALVVPRSHTTDLFDITADDLAACVHLAQQISGRAKGRLGADGVNLLNCSGEAAWPATEQNRPQVGHLLRPSDVGINFRVHHHSDQRTFRVSGVRRSVVIGALLGLTRN
jgi:hypothetical protein